MAKAIILTILTIITRIPTMSKDNESKDDTGDMIRRSTTKKRMMPISGDIISSDGEDKTGERLSWALVSMITVSNLKKFKVK